MGQTAGPPTHHYDLWVGWDTIKDHEFLRFYVGIGETLSEEGAISPRVPGGKDVLESCGAW